MITRLASRILQTRSGAFTEVLYVDDEQEETIALVYGDVSDGENVLVRVHSSCIGGHVFNSIECSCAAEMAAAQDAIRAAGRGVIIYLDQEGKGNGHLALMLSIPFKEAGHPQSVAYEMAGYSPDARSYFSAAEVLEDLRIASIVLLTDSRSKALALEQLGVSVSSTRDLAVSSPSE